MRDLLLVVPSRGRPGNIRRLCDAMASTCTGDTTLVVGLDADDPARDQYPREPPKIIMDGMRRVVPWINYLALMFWGQYRCIGHIGDDNVPMTKGWDSAMIEALEDTPFAFANDLYPRAPGSLSCHVFTRAEVIRALGYFGPPNIQHMYVDVAWMAWGKACGITYLHDVVIEHRHYTTGKSAADQSYHESTNLIPSDLVQWHQYSRGGGLNADIAKIDPSATPYSRDTLRQFNAELFIPEI